MRPLKLLRTASFRLAAAYLVLFTVSVLILGAVVYSVVAHESRSTVDARLEEESERLRSEFAQHGQDALIGIVDARGSDTLGMRYRLQAAGGARLAGDLEIASDAAPPSAGFSDVEEGGSDEDETGGGPEHVRVLETRLDNGSILLVGQEWSRANEAPRAVLIAFFWALAATLALGVVGGLVLSRAFLRRIDAMRETAEGVMDGDWRRRVPLIPGCDELSELGRTLNRMLDRIASLLDADKRMSAAIAHELRRPLSHAVQRLEEAESDERVAAKSDAIGLSIADIRSALDTFQAILRIGEVEAGRRRAAFRDVDLAEIAAQVVEAFGPTAEEEGRKLTFKLEAPLPLKGDERLLTQMVANVLDNAFRHTAQGAAVEVRCEAAGDSWRLVLADSGDGVKPTEMPHLFERFYRGASSRSAPGSGLGLSLVAAIAEMHGLTCQARDNAPGLAVVIEWRRKG